MKKLKIGLAFFMMFSVVVLSSMATAQDDAKIIVNANSPVSTLTRTDLVRIFKGAKTSWDDGSKIVLVVQEADVRGFFDLIDMSKRKYDKHWITAALSGKATPPKRVSGDAAAVSHVARTANSIGYVGSGAGLTDVKAVRIVE